MTKRHSTRDTQPDGRYTFYIGWVSWTNISHDILKNTASRANSSIRTSNSPVMLMLMMTVSQLAAADAASEFVADLAHDLSMTARWMVDCWDLHLIHHNCGPTCVLYIGNATLVHISSHSLFHSTLNQRFETKVLDKTNGHSSDNVHAVASGTTCCLLTFKRGRYRKKWYEGNIKLCLELVTGSPIFGIGMTLILA